jgi:hypothetical protein
MTKPLNHSKNNPPVNKGFHRVNGWIYWIGGGWMVKVNSKKLSKQSKSQKIQVTSKKSGWVKKTSHRSKILDPGMTKPLNHSKNNPPVNKGFHRMNGWIYWIGSGWVVKVNSTK